MDRMTMNVLVFQRVASDLELLTSEPLDDEDSDVVAVVLPEAA